MKHQGFTLIEFVVIISIFAIMAGVALVNFAGFRSNVGLNNLAHDIALTVRQAQVFGWATQSNNPSGVIELDVVTNNPVRYAHGVFFKYENGAFSKEFILYTKGDPSVGNEAYLDVTSTPDTAVDTITIQGTSRIIDVRSAYTKSDLLLGINHEIPQSSNQITESFSIAFSRPRPEAIFPTFIPASDNYLGIYVGSNDTAPGIADHVITISRFGEIAVQ